MKKIYLSIIIIVSALCIESAHAQYCPGSGVPTQPDGCIPVQRYICECKLTDGPPLEPNHTLTIGIEAPNQDEAIRFARGQMMCYPNDPYFAASVNCFPQ